MEVEAYLRLVYFGPWIIILFSILVLNRVSRENKHLKEENSRLQKELLQQVNENLRLKNNISTDTVE